MIWRAWCRPCARWNLRHSCAVSGPRIGWSASNLPRPKRASHSAITLSIRSMFSKTSVLSCSSGVPRGRARSGDFRPLGMNPSQTTARRCHRFVLRSPLALAFSAARQRSKFLIVPTYVKLRWSSISAELHLPSGWRAKSSVDMPSIALANTVRSLQSSGCTSSRMPCSNSRRKISLHEPRRA